MIIDDFIYVGIDLHKETKPSTEEPCTERVTVMMQEPQHLQLKGKSVGDLREELVPISHNRCSTKTCENILNAVAGDKVKDNDYQDARDVVTLGIVSDLQHYDTQLKEVDKQLEQMYHALGCTLTTIPGVNIITAVKIMAEIVS